MPESKRACLKAERDLLHCLLQSECYKTENQTPRECLQRGENMPEECKCFKMELFQCKRSQMDARTRFRGKRDEPL